MPLGHIHWDWGPPLLVVLEPAGALLGVACAEGAGHRKAVKLRCVLASLGYRREVGAVDRAQGEPRSSNIKGMPCTSRWMYKGLGHTWGTPVGS